MADPPTEDLKFSYGGQERVVKGAVRKVSDDKHELITGREVSKGGSPSDEVKNYRVDRIQGEIQRLDEEEGA